MTHYPRVKGPREFNPVVFEHFITEVEGILETFDYPDMIAGFCPDCVAKSMSRTMYTFYILGESPMMCAIIIWSMTWNEQIIPAVSNATKH